MGSSLTRNDSFLPGHFWAIFSYFLFSLSHCLDMTDTTIYDWRAHLDRYQWRVGRWSRLNGVQSTRRDGGRLYGCIFFGFQSLG